MSLRFNWTSDWLKGKRGNFLDIHDNPQIVTCFLLLFILWLIHSASIFINKLESFYFKVKSRLLLPLINTLPLTIKAKWARLIRSSNSWHQTSQGLSNSYRQPGTRLPGCNTPRQPTLHFTCAQRLLEWVQIIKTNHDISVIFNHSK